MKGTLVNTVAVLVGSGLGVLLKTGLAEKYKETVMQTLGLAVGIIGIKMALASENFIMVILSLVIGAIMGEYFTLNKKIDNLGQKLTAKCGEKYGDVGVGFVTASLIYCIGAMAIVGALQDGINGDAGILYAKALLDGISAIVFAATLGIGVSLSALSILVYQGSITLLAGVLQPLLIPAVITEITATGGVLIIAIALSMLNILKIRIANLLPSMLVVIFLAYLWKDWERRRQMVELQIISEFILNNVQYFIIGLTLIFLMALIVFININIKLAKMTKRYRRLMTGMDGSNIERLLMGHIDEVRDVVKQVNELSQQCQDNQIVLNKCLQKVGVVRFSAFEGVGSDLSYAIALLDENNNGFVLSSIFTRDNSRTYVKPIEKLESSYALTTEERQAIEIATK